jgi:hypothetical protein
VTEQTLKITDELVFCCKIYSKILKVELQSYLEQFMAEAQNGFRKECSSTDPNTLPHIINLKTNAI